MAVSLGRSANRRRCDHCGSHVDGRFRRLYGDEARRAHRCPDCDSWPRLVEGSAAGDDVAIPDPEEHPERAGARWSGC